MKLKDIKAPEKLGLLDLRRKAQVVKFSDGREVEVVGLSTRNIGDLMEKFIPLQKFFMGAPVTVGEILNTAPEAIPLIIAMGFREADNQEAVEAAADLTIEEQSELLEAIGKATFTRGFGPFDLRLRALGLAVKGETGRGVGYDLAEAAADLIAAGQDEEWVFGLTPRQLAAHAFLAERRRIRSLVDGITAATMGARVKQESLKEELKKLEKEL